MRLRFLSLVLAFSMMLISLAQSSCSLEAFDACDQEGAVACDLENGEQAYRKCSNGHWVEHFCPGQTFCQSGLCVECDDELIECSELYLKRYRVCRDGHWVNEDCSGELVCRQGECVAPIASCTEDVKECIDMRSVRVCKVNERPYFLDCGDKRYCEDGACVAAPVFCDETSTTCFDELSIQDCKAGDYAIFKACQGYDVCAEGQCIRNPLLCDESVELCLDQQTAHRCVKNELPLLENCGLESACIDGYCRPFTCGNNRWDVGEEAVDCGGPCEACQSCRVHGDCVSGFCDSAFSYRCSKRCRYDQDCKDSEEWDGEFCRSDGRCSPKVFETEWTVEAHSLDIILPYSASSSSPTSCQFQILWGDEPEGTKIEDTAVISSCHEPDDLRHVYAEAGTYRVKIIGYYRYWGLFNKINIDTSQPDGWVLTEHAPKLRKVISFGPVGLRKYAFAGCSALNGFPSHDIPNGEYLEDMSYFFFGNHSLDAPIGHWDVSNVTSMDSSFTDASVFNQDISLWDTSAVLDMKQLFASAILFDKPIGSWNTRRVKNMRLMFFEASSFNKPLASWDTSSVTDMELMFYKASSFNHGLEAWDTGRVTNMRAMFAEALSFNQDLSAWDVSNVKTFENTFANANVFNQPLNAWNTAQATNMGGMFMGARVFNQALDAWHTAKVTDMTAMFNQAFEFNQDLSTWKLNAKLKLDVIFLNSGIDETNYCQLIRLGGQWLTQRAKLGIYESIACSD